MFFLLFLSSEWWEAHRVLAVVAWVPRWWLLCLDGRPDGRHTDGVGGSMVLEVEEVEEDCCCC